MSTTVTLIKLKDQLAKGLESDELQKLLNSILDELLDTNLTGAGLVYKHQVQFLSPTRHQRVLNLSEKFSFDNHQKERLKILRIDKFRLSDKHAN